MMEEKSTGSFGWLIILLIFIVVLGGLFGGYGFFGGNKTAEAVVASNCNGVSNCQVEKQGIIDTARTQYLIEQKNNEVMANNNNNTQRLYDQSARQYEAGLQEKIFDLKINAQTTAILNDNALKQKDNEIAILKQTNHIDRRLDSIECNMLPRPKLYGVAATCGGDYVPPVPTR